MATTNFSRWLDTLVSEKELDLEHIFSKEGESGLNVIPLACVLDAIKGAPAKEQAEIRNTLVRIDYRNGDIMHFFGHLAGALAQ